MIRTPFILIAEDDADDRLMIQEVLDECIEKIEYGFAHDGEDLINELHNKSLPSLILMDLNMPKIDGRQALQMIKSEKGLNNIPVIVFTTSINDDDKQRCLNLGATDYIAKPSTYADMRLIVSRITQKWLNNQAKQQP